MWSEGYFPQAGTANYRYLSTKRATGLGVYRFTVRKRSKVYRFTVQGVYRFTVENFLKQETFPQPQPLVSRTVAGLWV